MKMTITVTVHIGPRTETRVQAEPRAVNTKRVKLKNGVQVSDVEIAQWIRENLTKAIVGQESRAS